MYLYWVKFLQHIIERLSSFQLHECNMTKQTYES